MTVLACLRSCTRQRTMPLPEIRRMTARWIACELRSRRAARACCRKRGNHTRRNTHVTCHAALTRVTRSAVRSAAAGIAPMRAQKRGRRMACRNRLGTRVRRRSIIERQCGDHRRLGSIHVTGKAEVARVTRRTARRNSLLAWSSRQSRKLAMTASAKIRSIV